jgi:HD-like signal output (HDOD) protein
VTQPTDDPGRKSEPVNATVLTPAIRHLPALTGTVCDLLALDLKDPELPEKLQEIVERDAALAGHVVRVANSAAYHGLEEVVTLGAAVARVGAPMIIGNAVQSEMTRIFDPYGGMGRRLAQIAVLEAHLMAALAASWEPRLGIAPERAYVHGLLHDLGHLIMAIKMGKALESFGHRRIPPEEVAQREATAFGFDHQSAGRMLAQHWKLPEEITLVIATHHHPRELRRGHPDAVHAIIEMLQLTDRLSRIIAQHADQRMRAETAIAEWLVTPEAQNVLQAVGGSADEVLTAVRAALSNLERDQRLRVGGGP